MAEAAKNAGTLTYTSEKKVFRYVDGEYTLTGDKVVNNGVMTEVQNGNIQKDGTYSGYFSVRMDGTEPKPNIGDVPLSEYPAVVALIAELIQALEA